jgi:hypothetical protein
MTIPKTNMNDIAKRINGKHASAAHLSNLPLDLLKQISRDLRICEEAMNKGEETDSFAAPFALILHLVANSDPKSGMSDETSFDEETTFWWYQKFTFFVESELVGRIEGVQRDKTSDLLSAFSQQH